MWKFLKGELKKLFIKLNSIINFPEKETPFSGLLKNRLIIASKWPECVGAEIAKKTSIKFFKDGILFIGTENSVWSSHLTSIKNQILDKLNEALAPFALKDIRFSAGSPLYKPKQAKRIPCVKHTLTEAEEQVVRGAAESVKNETLRKVTENIIRANILISKSG